MKKRASFSTLGDEITIAQKPKAEMVGVRGYWRPSDGTIAVCADLPEIEKVEVLIHEAMHFAEDILKQAGVIKRRVPHDFIEQSAFGIVVVMVHAGVIHGVTVEDCNAYVRAAKRRARRGPK